MKKLLLIAAVLIAGGSVIALTGTAASGYLTKRSDGICDGQSGKRHNITIQDEKAVPAHVDAKRCDTLTLTNNDDRLRNMAFGVHNQHKAYNGITEKALARGQSFSVRLTESGSFIVHDHLDETVGSTFEVSH